MGVTSPQAVAAFQQADKLQFAFGSVTSVAVDALAIGRYLSAGDLDHDNPLIESYVTAEDAAVYVISEVLQSDCITVLAQRERHGATSVDLLTLQQTVGAAVSLTREEDTRITFQGKEALTFGFKAFLIRYEQGDWRVRSAGASAGLAFSAQEPPEPAMLGVGRLLRL